MASESPNLDERLKSLIHQLQVESGILDKIVYKGKNQHRRCLYFQYLLKVRRDVRLLLSGHLEQILNFLFQVISGQKPAKTLRLLESTNKRKFAGARHNYQERLLGMARLLSQMVEPMVKAAIETSSLMGRSFFMGFCLTVLALLARLRVLVQQILLDVVSVFNTVSSFSQKEQAIKLKGEGIEFYREYYPSKKEAITLECVWVTDKFVLLEKTSKRETKSQNENVEVGREIPLPSSNINYQTIEAFLGEDEITGQEMDTDCLKDASNITGVKRCRTEVSGNHPITNRTEVGSDDDKSQGRSSDENVAQGGTTVTTSQLPSPKSQNLQQEPRSKVAFLSVRAPSQTNENENYEKAAGDLPATRTDNNNSFFSLISSENIKDSSLF